MNHILFKGTLAKKVSLIEIGQYVRSTSRAFNINDVETFIHLTGDDNPIHRGPSNKFDKPIVHGILCASLIPTLFAQALPGSIYIEQNLKFESPVYFGQQLSAIITVNKVRKVRNSYYVKCDTSVIIEKEERNAITGTATVMVPE